MTITISGWDWVLAFLAITAMRFSPGCSATVASMLARTPSSRFTGGPGLPAGGLPGRALTAMPRVLSRWPLTSSQMSVMGSPVTERATALTRRVDFPVLSRPSPGL